MKHLFLFIAFILPLALSAQLSQEEAKLLEGDWDGKLTFLRYSDNQEYTIELDATTTVTQEQFQITQRFKNVSKDREKGKDNLSLKKMKKPKKKMRLKSKEYSKEDNVLKMEFQYKGKDDNKKALITRELIADGDKITIKKWVVFEGNDEPLLRHTFTYTRKS